MKNLINSLQNPLKKPKIISAIVIALFITSMLVTVIPVVRAQEETGAHGGSPIQNGWIGPVDNKDPTTGAAATFTISPTAFLSVTPPQIGLGQEALVNMWITFPSGEGKFMNGYKVTITDPNGQVETVTKQSYVADGTAWFIYSPAEIGVYQFVFSFPGEYFPAGYYSNGAYSVNRTGIFANAIFNPSDYVTACTSQTMNLTVSHELAVSWDGLMANAGWTQPTDYWSRPIEPNNRAWTMIGGNYPWTEQNGPAVTNAVKENYYGPYIPSVATPHIVWHKVGALSGIIGAESGYAAQQSGPSTITNPSVIYMGRGYATVTKAINGLPAQQYAECFDIRTGEIYYDIPYISSTLSNTTNAGVTPTRIMYNEGVDSAVPGAGEAASWSVDLLAISGNQMYKINPISGAITANITLLPAGMTSWGSGGSPNLYFYKGNYLGFQVIRANSETPAPGVTVTVSYTGFIINWTSQGTSTNFTSRIVGNVSVTLSQSYRTAYQTSSYGNNLAAYDPESGISIQQNRFIYGGYYGSSYIATNIKTGQQIWNISTTVSDMESAYRPTNGWIRHGIYAYEMERGFIQARSEYTGAILWTTEIPDYPWGEFWMYDEASYGDLLYATGYTGTWALNETNGDIVWHYADPAPAFETPYTSEGSVTYAQQNIRVLGTLTAEGDAAPDGIVYVQNSEHTPTQPATRGWGLSAINATTGQLLWKIMGTALGAGSAADGYLVTTSSYDGTLNVMGKGQSKTTVSAPQVAITSGTPVVISGSVLDMSPASPNTPAISEASMATWMDYLHFQMPISGLYNNVTVTGVPVSIDAVDANGNAHHLADVTSDMSGTFAYTWTPSATGDWKITATFMGSNSYGSSYAQTYATVASAPAASPTPSTSQAGGVTTSDLMTYIVIAVVAIIIAIAIATVLILRKH